MKIKLSKPICFFDLETTGINISKDRIVEISILKVYPNSNKESRTWLVNPEISIPSEVSKIHGITNEMVINEPNFKEIGSQVKEMINNCDLGGFNSNKFDIPLLAEEFLRSNIDFDLEKIKCIDVQNIFHKMEKRTLGAAYVFYCKKEMENAHSAMYDARATLEVLKAQAKKYSELENNDEFLSEFSKANKSSVDYAGRIVLDGQNQPIINFGKHKGKNVELVFQKEPGYYSWILKGDFSQNTKSCFTKIWNEFKSKK